MAHVAPGNHKRKGITLAHLFKMFPNDRVAGKWLEENIWGGKRTCPACGSSNINRRSKHHSLPFRCRETACRKHFSIKTGSIMESSKLGYKVWAMAMYLYQTNLKGISSMRLHRELGVTQKTAWFILQRLREADEQGQKQFTGTVEVDETYIGGKVPKMNKKRRKAWKEKYGEARGGAGKILVAALRERESNTYHISIIKDTSKETLQPFVLENTAPDAEIHTDEAQGYAGIDRKHETVNHSEDEYVRYVLNGSTISINGVESVWFTFKTSILGVYHHISGKHLQRYLNQLAGRYNRRNLGTEDQMKKVARNMVGRRIRYADLTAKTPEELAAAA